MSPKSASAHFSAQQDNKTLSMEIIHRWNVIKIGNLKKYINCLFVRHNNIEQSFVLFTLSEVIVCMCSCVCGAWRLRLETSSISFCLWKSYENREHASFESMPHQHLELYFGCEQTLSQCTSHTHTLSDQSCFNCCLSYKSILRVFSSFFLFPVSRLLRCYF